jgi:hypothetical protein
MDTDVPHILSITNVPTILDQMQKAGVPEVFNRDCLKDLGFTASGDRPFIKVLKYLALLAPSGHPQAAWISSTARQAPLTIR